MSAVLNPPPCKTPDRIEVMIGLEPLVREQMALHVSKRKLWFPNELLGADQLGGEALEADLAQVREAAKGLPDVARVALALNLLTEEGLPHFHRLIAVYMGNESPWNLWNNLWTAEEDRHGCAMRDYVREARIFDMGALERMQYAYVEAGFEPAWEQDPYRLLAYTSLQEKATQISHSNTGRLCARYEPRGQRVLAHICADESRHYAFYRACFAGILAADPNQALQSLLKVTTGFAMPGHAVPHFDDMSEVLRRADIFGPRHYQKIVVELLEFWNIGGLTGLNAEGADAQDKLMKIPARLLRMAEYQEARTKPRSFSFDFIYQRSIAQ
jgi:acyl-[acyl-carrier-protein] desaturase